MSASVATQPNTAALLVMRMYMLRRLLWGKSVANVGFGSEAALQDTSSSAAAIGCKADMTG